MLFRSTYLLIFFLLISYFHWTLTFGMISFVETTKWFPKLVRCRFTTSKSAQLYCILDDLEINPVISIVFHVHSFMLDLLDVNDNVFTSV